MFSTSLYSTARVVALFGAVLGLIGCQRTPPPPPAPEPPKVTVARPVAHKVQSYFEYNGHMEAVDTVEVRARVKGLLQQIHFTDGQEVEPGTQLYTIDPREYKTAVLRATADVARAEADISNWKAQIRLAEAEFARASESNRAGVVAKTDLDKAAATLDVNKSQLAVSDATKDSALAAVQTANIQLGYTDIKATIGGRINRTLITRGNLVGQDQPTLLTTIVGMDPLYVYFDVPEKELVAYQRALRDGTASTTALRVDVGVATEDGYPHEGVLDFRENRVDPGTGTVRLRGRVPNPKGGAGGARVLYPGLYARVRVPNGEERPTLVVPEDALMTGQEGRFVYVVKNNLVEKRTVTVGPVVARVPAPGTAGPAWALAGPTGADGKPAGGPVRSVIAIEKGVAADELVVVNGLQKARPGAPVAPDVWELRPPAGR